MTTVRFAKEFLQTLNSIVVDHARILTNVILSTEWECVDVVREDSGLGLG